LLAGNLAGACILTALCFAIHPYRPCALACKLRQRKEFSKWLMLILDCRPVGGSGSVKLIPSGRPNARITRRELAAPSDRAGFPASVKMTVNREFLQRKFLKAVSIEFLPRLEYARLEYRANGLIRYLAASSGQLSTTAFTMLGYLRGNMSRSVV